VTTDGLFPSLFPLPRRSKTPLPHDLTVAAKDEKDRVARMTWLHQLETIPGVGTVGAMCMCDRSMRTTHTHTHTHTHTQQAKAIAILHTHPTLRSLLDVYDSQALSVAQKQDYLADKMGGDVRSVSM
jgi:hypothetical protein